jgi:hypothetical protein
VNTARSLFTFQFPRKLPHADTLALDGVDFPMQKSTLFGFAVNTLKSGLIPIQLINQSFRVGTTHYLASVFEHFTAGG